MPYVDEGAAERLFRQKVLALLRRTGLRRAPLDVLLTVAGRDLARKREVHMRKLIPVSAFLLAMPLGARAQSPAPAAADRVVTVMTRNLYFGADLGPTITARSPSELVAAATRVFATVQATSFPERVHALADEVARKEPA